MVKISVASKVLADRSADEVIDIAGDLGYGGIEWFGLPQHLPEDTSPARVRALAARAQDRGLASVCLSTYVGGFAEADDEGCALQLASLDRYLELATVLGCPVLRVWPDMMGRTVRAPVNARTVDRVAAWMGVAADRAAAAGRGIAMEMHQTIAADVALVERILEATGRRNLGAIYDPGNLRLARLPYGPDVVERLGDRIVHVQIKDADPARPTPGHLADEPALLLGGDFDLLLGEGDMDFVPILRALERRGYAGWYSVECHASSRHGLDSTEIARHELARLRCLFDRADAPGV